MKSIHSRLLALLTLCSTAPAALAAEAPRCQYVQTAALPLRYTGPSLQVTTEGRINGQPATMLVDTGADANFLTRTVTERLGLQLTTTGRYVIGIGGKAQVYRTRVDEFVAGPARSAKGYLPVLTDFGMTPAFDAILGAPFLMQSDIELSLATKELRFFKPLANCADTFLAYWDPQAHVLAFESKTSDQENPRFQVRINGQRFIAMIDSGATTSSIVISAARRAGFQPDAPGNAKPSTAVGVGQTRITRWTTRFATFEIGNEAVDNVDFGVTDRDADDYDILLGDDFLRAHRLLFAMSQQKLYFSYVGGAPFGQRRTIEPWMQAEADAGNADAQLALANAYAEGDRAPKNPALAAAWLEKATRGGSAHAQIISGRARLTGGQWQEAASLLRAGLDQLPAHRSAPLWLYLARLHLGQQDLATRELAAALARNEDNEWPGAIGARYLGKIDTPALLAQAGAAGAAAPQRRCEALQAVREWHQARGETALATATAEQAAACAPGANVH